MVMGKLNKRMMREIRINFGQFLSITMIIAIGAMLMSGMFSAITAMDNSTKQYYEKQKLADLWVYFKGIHTEDAQKLIEDTGAEEAEPRYTLNEQFSVNGADATLRLHSLTDINSPLLTTGALPQKEGEIILDYKFAEANNLTVGSVLQVNNISLTITGLFMDPEYAYKQKDSGASVNANRSFGIGYALKDTLITQIKASDSYQEVNKETQDKLDDAQAQLEDARSKLNDAEQQYNTKKAESEQSVADALNKLLSTKESLDKGQSDLNYQKKLSDEKAKTAQSELDGYQQQLDAAKVQTDQSYAQYEKLRDTLPEDQQKIKDNSFAKQYQELKEKQDELDTQQNTLNLQNAKVQDQLSQKQSQLNSGYAQYEDSVSKLNQTKEESTTKLSETRSDLDKSWKELDENEKEFLSQKEEANEELINAAESYQEILFRTSQPDTVLLAAEKLESYQTYVKRENQPSFVNVNSSLDPIRSVSYIFPMIFFLVAAIVAFISLSKTVENQRTQIAVMQALGISKMRIRFYFLSYAALASLCGAIPFALLGNFLIPKLLIRVFMSRFALPSPAVPVYLMYFAIPLLLALLFSGCAALIAVQKVLREIPAQAMRPRPPKGTKTILLERIPVLWQRLGYSGKLILRNIFLNKGRIVLSSIGVIGSVMLIFTGLSLQNSATQVIRTATDSIGYDLSVNYKEPVTDKNSIQFDFPVDRSELSESKKATLKFSEDVDITLQLVENSSTMIHPSGKDGNPIQFDASSVILPDSLAKEYGLSVGDSLQLAVEDENYTVTITGFCTQYTSKTLYMSFESAAAVGMDASAHTLLLTLPQDESAVAAAESLSKLETVKSAGTREDFISRSQEMLKTLNATILILLVSAAMLGMTVIYNITSINIFERTREYATLMVLGYYKREVNRLILRENMALTLFGSLFGLPSGYYLFVYLTQVISQSNLSIPNSFDLKMAAATLLLTAVFALVTNLLLQPKVKKIVLVEALKSVE